MQIHTVNRAETGLFSDQQLKLVNHQNELESLIAHPFSSEAFEGQINTKSVSYSVDSRSVLVGSLRKQYANTQFSDAVRFNLEKLAAEKTFTVTTGHQLSLLTGPLYFILKIMHVIKQAEVLNEQYPTNHFVPIYWMASEDHDFEEVQSLHLFGKSVSIDYNQRGAVGRFTLEQFEAFKAEIRSFFGDEKSTGLDQLLDAYSGANLAEATRNLVNALFGDKGLVIVDGDDAELKQLFAPIMKRELTEGFAQKAVLETNKEIARLGLSEQIHARPINLFYLADGLRERIIASENGFSIEGVGTFASDELLRELDTFPERFSPNVVLRPVYQETILPNLAYVGGGGEMAYWLQLRKVFEEANIPYPLIQVRNSFIIIDKTTGKKMSQAGLSLMDIFENADVLKKKFVIENADDSIDFSGMENALVKLSEEILTQVVAVEPNLEKYAQAENARLEKQLDGIKSKLIKTAKGKHETVMNAIDVVKERLFPENGLQERRFNFLHFCADGKIAEQLARWYEAIAPFETGLIILDESESAK